MSDDGGREYGFGPQAGDGPDGARDRMTRPSNPGAAQSPLAGFLNDGIPGLIAALDAQGASIEDDVEDPSALRAAEDAVMRGGSEVPGAGSRRAPRIDESWSVVATQLSPADHAGLDDVARLLESDGVDFGWDPMDPREAVGFTPPAAGLFAGKLASIVVPASQVGAARQSLYGQPPQGVTYPWSEADAPLFHSDAAAGMPAPPVGRSAVPVTGADPRLSDNARLAGLAGGGMSVARGVGLVFIVLALLGIVLTMASLFFSRG